MQTEAHAPMSSLAPTAQPLARSIATHRDYREAVALLGRTMRASRSHQGALRAEALLAQVIDYEVRLDAGTAGESDDPAEATTFGGLKRRWIDYRN